MDPTPTPPDLISLATHPDHNAISRFSNACSQLDAAELVDGYGTLMARAPHRHHFKRRYFVGHDGRPSSGAWTNRIEEHLAIALVNDRSTWTLPDGGSLDLLDYQVPLKAQRSDAGVGKIDIFGLTDTAVSVVIELKVLGKNKADTPLRALLEALAYAAIVDANGTAFRSEISGMTGRTVTSGRPNLLIAAPDDYWSYWSTKSAAGAWQEHCGDLAGELADRLGIDIEMLSIGNPGLEPGLDGQPPRLTSDLTFETVGRWSGRRPVDYSPEK
ncbi:MAG: hypothetical protein U9N78_01185 [Actinomycetota bacterium]|nr:hypothetical protein [Actinomycetota bacterium]